MPQLSNPHFSLVIEVEAKRAAEEGRFHPDDPLVRVTEEGHVTVREGAIPDVEGVTWPDGSYVQPWGIHPAGMPLHGVIIDL